MTDFTELKNAILSGNRKAVIELVQAAIDAKENPNPLIDNAMIPAMREIGDKFSKGEAFVPELLVAARAMQSGLKLLEPLIVASGRKPKGTVAIGTVLGDLHDIGKNLVSIMLKGADYDVIDLGVNCDVSKFDAGVEQGAKIIAVGALLTTTMPYMQNVVEHFKGTGIKVIIGGAAVSKEFSDSIGADGFCVDANDAVKIVDAIYPK